MNKGVYNPTTIPNNRKEKWTGPLLVCIFVASIAQFSHGFNIGVTNLPTPLVRKFYADRYFSEYYIKSKEFENKSKTVELGYNYVTANLMQLDAKMNASQGNETIIKTLKMTRMMLEMKLENLTKSREILKVHEVKLKEAGAKVESLSTILWTLTTSIFVVGGAIGAFTSKYVAEYFGRKKGTIFHYVFAIIASILTIISVYVNSPECIIIGRFIFGLQAGMACGLVPAYVTEISPKNLRGAANVIPQLFLTMGILSSQVLGFRQILGRPETWHFLLGLSSIPCLIGGILYLIFLPESPSFALIRQDDRQAAEKALRKLRKRDDVSDEIEEIEMANAETKNSNAITISELFTSADLRWPLITGVVIQFTQQWSGINAIFFYSSMIFKDANIADQYIQYAVFSTGLINVISTIVAVPLMDKLGRKPLLVGPFMIIIIDFIVLTFLLIFKEKSIVMSYLSIVCIVIFIICFAVGLGPIPFLYVAEVFGLEARSNALAVCMFVNWFANLLLSLTFPYLQALLTSYVFLVFTVIVATALALVWFKVPETKGRSLEEIIEYFNPKRARQFRESSGKLMPKQ